MPLVLKPKKKISEIDFDAVRSLAQDLHCDELFAQILYNRGFTEKEACMAFLYPDASQLLDPFSMLHMQKAAEQIRRAVQKGRKIVIYGDYDVDGVSAAAILFTALRRMGAETKVYIPDRHKEGYGLNMEAVQKLFSGGDELLITVDCGIASADIVQKAAENNWEMIVTDHHSIAGRLPACTVLKPGQPGDTYQNTALCGAGIAFKLAQALLGNAAEDLIDYACVATVADVVPLTGENRYIVKKGLEYLNRAPRACFHALLDAAAFSGEVTSQTIGFTIAPRLNAAGRMESADTALALLLSDGEQARENAQLLCSYNQRRQEREKEILTLAEEKIKAGGQIRRYKVIVAGGEGWDDGVIGICAARLAEKYKRPCLLFSIDQEGIAKGSARSVPGVDLFEMLSANASLFEKFGGHQMAAGMSIKRDRLDELARVLDRYIRQNADLRLFYPWAGYDARAKLEQITLDFCRELALFEPTGCENSPVSLRFDNCLAGGMKKVGAAGAHLKLYLQDDTARNTAVAFHYQKHECDYFRLARASVIAVPEINTWQSRESVSLKIENVKEMENIKAGQFAEELTAAFFERLVYPVTNQANVCYFDESSDLAYQISQWEDEDIAGTLILCDHPEYAAGCIRMLEEEAPRYDISLYYPINACNGYNSLVLAADISQIDFSVYTRIVVYDLLNPGFADFLAKKAPWAEIFALKCDVSLFDTIFEDYKQFSRQEMLKAYKALQECTGIYESRSMCIREISSQKQLTMPLLSVALDTFCELGFLECQKSEGFTVKVEKNAAKRNLEESVFYAKLLKCVNRRGSL